METKNVHFCYHSLAWLMSSFHRFTTSTLRPYHLNCTLKSISVKQFIIQEHSRDKNLYNKSMHTSVLTYVNFKQVNCHKSQLDNMQLNT